MAHAQASANVSANSSVTVFRPITLTKNSDLSFGTIVRPSTGSGTVTIAAADGARTYTGGVALLTTTANGQAAAGRATFQAAGEGAQTFSITTPATFDMTRSGGGTLTVTLTPSSTTGTLSSTLGSAGTAAFGVGGQITVDNTTATGAYTGSFTTTVAYN